VASVFSIDAFTQIGWMRVSRRLSSPSHRVYVTMKPGKAFLSVASGSRYSNDFYVDETDEFFFEDEEFEYYDEELSSSSRPNPRYLDDAVTRAPTNLKAASTESGFLQNEERGANPLVPIGDAVAGPRHASSLPIGTSEFFENGEEPDEYESGDDDLSLSSGNFWFNPFSDTDDNVVPRVISRASQSGPSSRPNSKRSRAEDRPRRTTFRTGVPRPPPPIREFYEKLFWFGLDNDENSSSSPADPTVFGGTKGKFNGLSYLRSSSSQQASPTARRRRRDLAPRAVDESSRQWRQERGTRSSRSPPMPGDVIRDEDDPSSYVFRGPVTPPYDVPYPRRGSSPSKRSPTRDALSEKQRDDRADEDSVVIDVPSGDWVEDEVSTWFTGDDYSPRADVGDFGTRLGEPNRRRAVRRPDSPDPRNGRRRAIRSEDRGFSSPLNALDVFLGGNRKTLSKQAQMYEEQMGLKVRDQKAARKREISTERPRRRRNSWPPPDPRGEVSREQAAENINRASDYSEPVHAEAVLHEEPFSEQSPTGKNSMNDQYGEHPAEQPMATDVGRDTDSIDDVSSGLSWEARAIAVEKVPPADVPAWGPTGEIVGMDARTKSISDALEDLAEVKGKVKRWSDRLDQISSKLSVMKVDAAQERLRQDAEETERYQDYEDDEQLYVRRPPSARLRRMEQLISEVSRDLRYAQQMLQVVRREEKELEQRHWAVLSFYNPAQAAGTIDEALRQLALDEPAVQRYLDRIGSARYAEASTPQE
jgi:hypothetical protein